MPKPCQCNRWGTGNCAPPASKEPQSQEMKSKLEQMMAERNRQDTMWYTPTPSDLKYTQEKAPQTNGKTHG
jgi:hypothetical protein